MRFIVAAVLYLLAAGVVAIGTAVIGTPLVLRVLPRADPGVVFIIVLLTMCAVACLVAAALIERVFAWLSGRL